MKSRILPVLDIDKITELDTSGATIDVAAFGGWIANGTPYDPGDSFTPEGNITITVNWTPYHTVTYEVEDLTSTATATPSYDTYEFYVLEGENTKLLGNAAFEEMYPGYRLDGWLCSEDYASHNPGETYLVSKDVIFVAKFTKTAADTYTVKYVNGVDGTEYTGLTSTVEAGTTIQLSGAATIKHPTDPDGYTFDGWVLKSTETWYAAGADYPVNGDVVFKATWKKIEPTVTCTAKYYLDQDAYNAAEAGTADEHFGEKKKTAGESITLLGESDLTTKKEGYTFKGWYTSVDKTVLHKAGETYTVTTDVNFIGLWEENVTYNVRYYANLSDYKNKNTPVKNEKNINDGATIQLPGKADLDLAGIDFLYWWSPNTNQTYEAATSFTVEKNTVFVAIFKSDKLYNVKYNLDGGTYDDITGTKYSIEGVASEGTEVVVADDAALVITKSGYTFKGWSYAGKTYKADGSAEGALTYFEMPGHDVTLTAVWEKDKAYTVAYDFDGGKVGNKTTFATVNYDKGDTVPIKTDEPEKTGYIFLGWTSSVTGDEKLYNADSSVVGAYSYFTMPAENVTLKAKWLTAYTLKYNFNGSYYVDTTGTTWTRVYEWATDYYKEGALVTVTDRTLADKEGQRFLGWRSNAGEKELYAYNSEKYFFFMPDQNVELTAEWANVYTVSFDLQVPTGATAVDGTVYVAYTDPAGYDITDVTLADRDIIDGETLEIIENPASYKIADANGAYTTYQFAGWKINDTGKTWTFGDEFDSAQHVSKATGKLTLTALWDTEAHYTIVFKDKLTEADSDEAMFVAYNGKKLADVYTSTEKADKKAIKALTLTSVSENSKIPYGTLETGESKYPEFTRVDYTLGDNDRDYVNDWYMENKAGKTAVYDVEKTLKENNVADYADENGVVTLYANWEYKYAQKDNGDYQVIIDTSELDNGKYGEYYSDYIDATTDPAVVGAGKKKNIYRNFYLTDQAGNPYTSPDHSVSGLPEGLYLNKLTGEIYGVPKTTGDFSFYVKMESDANEGAKPISAVKEIKIHIDQLPITVDRKAGDGNIFDKTYGDVDEKALNLNNKREGKTYVSNNMDVTLDGTALVAGTRVAIEDAKGAKVELTTSSSDQTASLAYTYVSTISNRKTLARRIMLKHLRHLLML